MRWEVRGDDDSRTQAATNDDAWPVNTLGVAPVGGRPDLGDLIVQRDAQAGAEWS